MTSLKSYMKPVTLNDRNGYPSKKLLLAIVWLMMVVTNGSGQIIADPQITALMERWKTYNLEHQELSGFRIQIMASVDRRQMESLKRSFENKYPEYPVVFLHNDPFYHLKVGAFLTMQKTQAFLKKMQHDYPQAIPVTDLLKVEELLLYD